MPSSDLGTVYLVEEEFAWLPEGRRESRARHARGVRDRLEEREKSLRIMQSDLHELEALPEHRTSTPRLRSMIGDLKALIEKDRCRLAALTQPPGPSTPGPAQVAAAVSWAAGEHLRTHPRTRVMHAWLALDTFNVTLAAVGTLGFAQHRSHLKLPVGKATVYLHPVVSYETNTVILGNARKYPFSQAPLPPAGSPTDPEFLAAYSMLVGVDPLDAVAAALEALGR